MSPLADRLAELRRHLAHLGALRPHVSRDAIERDLSLHNDVLFSPKLFGALALLEPELPAGALSEAFQRFGWPVHAGVPA